MAGLRFAVKVVRSQGSAGPALPGPCRVCAFPPLLRKGGTSIVVRGMLPEMQVLRLLKRSAQNDTSAFLILVWIFGVKLSDGITGFLQDSGFPFQRQLQRQRHYQVGTRQPGHAVKHALFGGRA
jgi:hypothetical protein